MPRSRYQIVVSPAENGFIVDVGCMRLIFSRQEFVTEMTKWVADPGGVEYEYLKQYRPVPSLGAADGDATFRTSTATPLMGGAGVDPLRLQDAPTEIPVDVPNVPAQSEAIRGRGGYDSRDVRRAHPSRPQDDY